MNVKRPISVIAALLLALCALCACGAAGEDAADGAGLSGAGLTGGPDGSGDMAAYTVRYVDQDGQPVEGVTLQVCDESICQLYVSDKNGVCEFSLPPYAYELHTLKLPDGYEGGTGTVTLAPVDGGELTFTLQKR